MVAMPPPPSHDAREVLRNKIMLSIMAVLAFVFMVIVLITFLLPRLAPAPLEFRNNPSPVASNPADPDHWDFSNNAPVFHPGDALIVEVVACINNPFGDSIRASGSRRLVSVDGLVSDQLDGTDTVVPVRPCMTSHTNAGMISKATPSGKYRIEASVHGVTSLYTRDSMWYTIWFEVANP
jgi:hypothetical protein